MNARHFLAVLPLLASGLWAASPLTNDLALPERVVSGLDPILIQATSQSPRMLSRALELEMAENNRIMARASVLPSVGASYRRYESKDERADVAGTLPTSKIYYDISINQPLFHWGERRNLAKIGEIQKSIATGNYAEAYRFLVQELRQKYLDLIVLRQQVSRERLFLNYAKGEVALGEDRLAKKVISDMEMFPIRLRGEQAQIAFERAEFNYAQTKDSFVRLTGLDRLEDAQLPDEIPRVGYSAQAFNQLLAAFLSKQEFPTTEVVSLRRQLEIDELHYRNAKTRLRPKLNLVAGINQDEQSYTLNTVQKYRVKSFFGGFTATWSIFDGFASQAVTRNALARRRLTEIGYEDLVHRIGQQAQSQAKYVDFAARTMAISDRAFHSATGNLNSKQDEFRRGLVSESDVTVAEIFLMDARISAYHARADYMIRIGDFLGTLVEDPASKNLSSK